MAHENKNEAPGNKASEIKKNVVELNENDLSKVAGGFSAGADDADRLSEDDIKSGEGRVPGDDDGTIDDGNRR